jgi:hypothetical protein
VVGPAPRRAALQAELARLLTDPVYWGHGVPHGDGAPVLLVPGFLAGDSYLVAMRDWLERIGYAPSLSGILMNVDCSDRALRRLDARLAEVHAEAGRPVTSSGTRAAATSPRRSRTGGPSAPPA